MNKIFIFFKNNKEGILYLVFGGITTLVNIITYEISFTVIKIPNIPSTIIAWTISVLCAYITNRKYVFESKKTKLTEICKELISFILCRIGAEIVEVGIMYFTVDVMHWNHLLWKIVSNVLVVILNYITSKAIIFHKKEK